MFSPTGGRLREIAIPATAGNVSYTSITPAANTRLHVISGIITLVCDATVANRRIRVGRRISAGGAARDIVIETTDITASQTKVLAFNRTLQLAAPAYIFSDFQASIGWILRYDATNPDILMVSIGAGVAGDSFTGSIQCWEEPA